MLKQPTVVVLIVLTTPDDYGGRGKVLSTVDNYRHRMITSPSVQLCVQRDGRLDVTASRAPSASVRTCRLRQQHVFDADDVDTDESLLPSSEFAHDK